MEKAKKLYMLIWVAGMLFGLVSCTPEIRLDTQGTQAPGITGNFTVIYYGCNFLNDLETIAFLNKEDGKYTFEPYAAAFEYRVKKGLPAKEALESAMKFVNCSTAFKRAQVSGILGPGGETIGYEVRPLYEPFTYGASDVLYVGYGLKDGKVIINVRPLEMVPQDSGATRKER